MKLLLYSLLILFSCTAFAKKKTLSCPVDPIHGGEKKVPVHDFTLSGGDRILICIPEPAEGAGKPKFYTQYDAYLFSGNKAGKRVLTGNLTTPVRFEQRKGALYEIIHLNLRGDLQEIYKEKIACAKGVCHRKEKTCIFNHYHISPPSPKDLERERILIGKASAQVQEMTEADLFQMSTLALSGRKKAFDFFFMDPRPIVLGSAAVFYQNMQSLLTDLQSEGCLKLSEK